MFDMELFENSAKENGTHYWLAHEFMRSLGYENWSAFRAIIFKAQASCLQLGIETEETFIPVTLDDGTKSYKLTRFACFLVAMQADPKKPEVAAAQIALAAIAEMLVEEKLADSGIARIEERTKLSSAEKQLSGIAKAAGLTTGDEFAIFKDAGFRGMYNMALSQLKDYKGAPAGNKTLYDYMGLTELAANTFRITQTAERIKNTGARGLDKTSSQAKQVGKEVREVMLRSSGVAPEDLALECPIQTVKKQIKSANRKMKQLDQVKKKK